MKKIVFLDRATFAADIQIPGPKFEHEWTNYAKTNAQQALKRALKADLIVSNKVIFNHSLLSNLPQLKHIAIAATGTNCVDLKAAAALGISVSNVPGYAMRSVSEHVIAMILGLRRNFFAYQNDIAAGKWQASEQFCFYNNPITDIAGSTLGLIGTGAIAQQVADLAKAFGMKVIFHSVSGRKEFTGKTLVTLNTLLTKSDVISVHCPLCPKSENLINMPQLELMRPNALLINTARGSIINLKALHHVLSKNLIAGAGIDVAPTEPPPLDSPIMALNSLNNCIVTPHTAWASKQSSQALINQVVDNLEFYVSGNPINIVKE